ncbi:O-antigen ligase family protein [Ignatzschineria cameli]|uniref:O-antigen ligase family protein n=1 Tax=Ignatzschineria cameli TaxID=2182793 RepID=UPI000D619AFF|nr:O-antigen ligase family protein [Ignatzschineria cameli]PWD85343.1 hypothetical protein DC080_06715 [Ignatzschineria cameli]
MSITTLQNFCKKNLFLFFYILLFTMILGRTTLEVVASLGMLFSFYLLARNWSYYFDALVKSRYLYVSLAFVIPIGISLLDTLGMAKALSVFLQMLRYLFIGVIAIAMTQNMENYQRLLKLTFYTLMFICIDAIIQWLTNYNIYGYNPVVNNRVRGIFKDYHLSYFLGTFAPIVLFYLYKKLKEKYTLLRLALSVISIILLITAVIVGGARAGMISLFVSIALFIGYLFYTGAVKHKLRFLGGVFVVLALGIGIVSQSKIVQERFHRTTSSFGSDQFLKQFTSSRTNIWYVGFNEIPNYWINGVGPRAFDKVYQTYPEDYKIYKYVFQPHLHGLEVMIETGVIGFIPYLLVLLYLFVRMFKARAGNEWIMMGFVAMMPINSHVGLYENFWMPMVWIPIMLGLSLGYKTQNLKIK